MLSKLQTLKEEREQGFTLIELLVVILIIGILSAIAIPAFMNQRKSAVDSSVQSDVSNAAKQVETLAVKAGATNAVVTVSGVTAGKQTITVTPTGKTALTVDTQVSDGTVLSMAGDTQTGFRIQGINPGGDVAKQTTVPAPVAASKGFLYDSANGGLKSQP